MKTQKEKVKDCMIIFQIIIIKQIFRIVMIERINTLKYVYSCVVIYFVKIILLIFIKELSYGHGSRTLLDSEILYFIIIELSVLLFSIYLFLNIWISDYTSLYFHIININYINTNN
jgi:hypothetical protein